MGTSKVTSVPWAPGSEPALRAGKGQGRTADHRKDLHQAALKSMENSLWALLSCR